MANPESERNIKQEAKNIVNVETAGVVNNNTYISSDAKSSKIIFNKVFISEVILSLKKEPGNIFPENLSFIETENWTNNPVFLQDALTYIAKNFIWVIGDEIRRLFYIGNFNKYTNESDRITDYINRSIRIYRSSLQLMNYVFISKLWDEKIKNNNINTDKAQIRKFFETKILLSLKDLRVLFLELIEIFKSNGLDFPLNDEHLGHLEQFIEPDGEFNKACLALEKMNNFDREKVFDSNHHETSEKALATILSSFIFLTKYKLVSVRRIEYSEARNSAPQYYKDINLIKLPLFQSDEDLKNAQMENLIDHLKFDPNKPQITNSVFFTGSVKSTNLFPFLIDYNALTDEVDFQLYYYDCLEGKSGMRYFCAKEEQKETVPFIKARPLDKNEMRNEERVNEFKEDTCKELVTKQFSESMKTLLNVEFKFELEETHSSIPSF